MTHTVHCIKLQKEAPGLDRPPMPGEIGQKIYDHISKEVWLAWIAHQTTLINEHRLNMLDKDARSFLLAEMQQFLFGTGSKKPAGYVAKNASST